VVADRGRHVGSRAAFSASWSGDEVDWDEVESGGTRRRDRRAHGNSADVESPRCDTVHHALAGHSGIMQRVRPGSIDPRSLCLGLTAHGS
jgi:hypothetical protein